MSGFIARVANYLANEIMVKKLVENKNFQQFAFRTAQKVEKAKGAAGDIFDSAVDDLAKKANDLPNQTSTRSFSSSSEVSKLARLFEEVKKEVAKDLGGGKK